MAGHCEEVRLAWVSCRLFRCCQKIPRLCCSVGRSKETCRSSGPGFSGALSTVSARLGDAGTATTWLRDGGAHSTHFHLEPAGRLPLLGVGEAGRGERWSASCSPHGSPQRGALRGSRPPQTPGRSLQEGHQGLCHCRLRPQCLRRARSEQRARPSIRTRALNWRNGALCSPQNLRLTVWLRPLKLRPFPICVLSSAAKGAILI